VLKVSKSIKDSPSNDPPPPDLAAGGGGGGGGFSTTLAVACADWPLAADVQVRIKLKVSGAGGAEVSVTDTLPLVAFVPNQPSLVPPPVAEQLLALAELHVSIVACPALTVVGEAVNVAVTVGHVKTTEVWAC
jgi:hypothetical protein